MYLSIIITVFVVLQVITLVLIYKWWKKYGKTIFKSFTGMKGLSPNGFNPGQMPDMGEMMKQFQSITKNMNKFK